MTTGAEKVFKKICQLSFLFNLFGGEGVQFTRRSLVCLYQLYAYITKSPKL